MLDIPDKLGRIKRDRLIYFSLHMRQLVQAHPVQQQLHWHQVQDILGIPTEIELHGHDRNCNRSDARIGAMLVFHSRNCLTLFFCQWSRIVQNLVHGLQLTEEVGTIDYVWDLYPIRSFLLFQHP